MAESKNSFVLYVDLKATIDQLPDDKAGQLFKLILDYVNDLHPEPTDLLLKIAFEPIRQQLKRDLVKWDAFRQKQAENGSKGGRPKKPNDNPENPSLLEETQKSLSVSVTVSDSVNEDNNTVVAPQPKNLEEKSLEFRTTLVPFSKKYDGEMLKKFFLYWTEPTKNKKKLRWELEKTWEISRRLENWSSRNNTGFQKTEQPNTISAPKATR